ncbi:MAG: hypothetical protein N3E51_04535, partial [Candidatus Micrarchaeota archaeon]|nr:hypothetical protein [Candidatus Micrarchaeota archaeon]
MISALTLALAYMAGKLFELAVLDAWVKIELQELATSAIIAVFCVALIASVGAFSGLLIGDVNAGSAGTGALALNSLSTVYQDGSTIYSALSDAYYKLAKVASYSYTVGLNLHYVSTSRSSSPASGLSTLVAQIGGAMDSVSNFMLALAGQQALVIFFINSAQVLLPIGIFLRCFSITRKIGAAVLAAVITTSVVYPASFAISDAVYRTYHNDLTAGENGIRSLPNPGNPPLAWIICSPWMQWVVESPLGIGVGLLARGASIIPGMGEFTATMISSIGMAVFGGENGWFLTVCPIVSAIICAGTGPGYPACFT